MYYSFFCQVIFTLCKNKMTFMAGATKMDEHRFNKNNRTLAGNVY